MNTLDPQIVELDNRLHALVSKIDILDAIGPLNYGEQRQEFFDCLYSRNPRFAYKPHNIESFILKRNLFNLPVDTLVDDDLKTLYCDVIDSYVDKIDQFKSIGTGDFLYDSLRYYGEPSEKDIRNAHFVLHLPESDDTENATLYDAEAIQRTLSEFADREGYQYQFKLDDAMIANALVSGTTIKINRSAKIDEVEVMALAHHELGVHLVTTLNARAQPLKILSLGCPVNTTTQEGLALLCEYLAGCMTPRRLKIMALRVLAVKSMIQGSDFRNTFLLLKEQYHVEDRQAFTITARVYRGGGFTKDHLYLKGFRQMINAYDSEPDFHYLLAGKTSLDYLPLLSRLIEKEVLLSPKIISPAIRQPVASQQVSEFIVHAIK